MKYKRLITKSLLILMLLLMLLIVSSRWYNPKYSQAHSLGIIKGQFTECSENPNCVSSQTTQNSKRILPIETGDPSTLAWSTLREVIGEMPQAVLISEDKNYRHYQFTSSLMGFIDDVELQFDGNNKQIQVKSASRIGHSDLGANRNRIELLRKSLADALSLKK